MSSYKKRKFTNVYGILILLSFLLILSSYLGLFRVIPIFEIFTTTIDSNVSNVKVSLNNFFYKFEQNEALAKENIDLRKKNTQLNSEIGRIADYQKELDSLKNYNKVTTTKKESVMAKTISIFISKVPVKIIIDKGERNGLKKGQVVVNDTGSLIGILDSVELYTSVVKPYYSYEDIKFPIKSSSTQTALIQGVDSNGNIIGVDLGQNNNINVGDAFYTSGLGDKMPEGIFLGKIAKFQAEDKKTFILDTDILNNEILYVLL